MGHTVQRDFDGDAHENYTSPKARKAGESTTLSARVARPGFLLLPSGRCHLEVGVLEGRTGRQPRVADTLGVWDREERRGRETFRRSLALISYLLEPFLFFHFSVDLSQFLLRIFLVPLCYFLLCLSTSSFTKQPRVLFFSVS